CRTKSFDRHIGLAVRDAVDHDGHATWRRKPAHLAVSTTRAAQFPFETARECLGQCKQRLRGKFLGADLNQKVALCHLHSTVVVDVIAAIDWTTVSVGRLGFSVLLVHPKPECL